MTNICKYKIIQYLLCQQLTLIIKFAAPKGTSVKESKSDPVLSLRCLVSRHTVQFFLMHGSL